jgi:hypothetical protein
MAAPRVVPYRAAHTEVATGGKPVIAVFGGVAGGVLLNPSTPADQGLAVVEVLYVDPTGAPAAAAETDTTFPLQPGQWWFIPAGQATDVSVNAKSSGHKFSAYVLQPTTQHPPMPQPGLFPPAGPVVVQDVIPSYLYRQYADDEDLQAFVASFNALAQEYLDWLNETPLPIYTDSSIFGLLLDWVAEGLYGQTRPALASGRNRDVGPYDTWQFNTIAYDQHKVVGSGNVTVTTDDIFKRIITWNFWKGDGKTFNIRWLKRRIMRFMNGLNGSAPNVDQTYQVGVTFGIGSQVNITLVAETGKLTLSSAYDTWKFNTRAFNQDKVTTQSIAPLPNAIILAEAIRSGALQLPFQFTYVVVT